MRSAELNRNRRIGCEYEFAIPLIGSGDRVHVQQMIANILSSNGLPALARPYSHEPIPAYYAFAVEYDSSVQGESIYNGITWIPVELKTRPLTGYDEWEALLPKALSICSYLGGRANRTCGHHLHLELCEFTDRPAVARSLYNLFHRFENVIFGLVPPSRRTCGYCRPLQSPAGLLNDCRVHQSLREKLPQAGSRYNGLNLTHLYAAGGSRVEIRYAGGTLDPDKARHWLRFSLQMIQHSVTRTCHAGPQVAADRKGLDRLFTACGFRVNSRIYPTVAPELRSTGRYLAKRWTRFHSQASPHTSREVEIA